MVHCVERSVGLFVTVVSPAKTAETIEMPFGLWARGIKEPCIRWSPDRHICRGKF